MKVVFNIAHGLLWPAALSVTLLAVDAYSAEACPKLVESRAGSVFNMSAFIKDNGSPEAALDTARAAVSKVNKGGGCGIFSNVAACEETLTLAAVAITALQACIASPIHRNSQNTARD
jgi:hypothetical protein